MKRVVIIGAGPAGLTAGYYLLKNSKDYEVIIVEKDKQVGGISKTITYNGNKMDLGGHRFFTKDDMVNELWKELLEVQGYPSYDDLKLHIEKDFNIGGPNPEKERDVFLIRNRVSRIYYNNKFFDYPVNLNFRTIRNLGFVSTMKSGFSYLKSLIVKKDETNLENFYINRFGKEIYTMFFKEYTEKVWGREPGDIDASWGRQRVKGLSIFEVIKNSFCRLFHIENNKQSSLIQGFYYPKYGPGQMYEKMEKLFVEMGGKIYKNYDVTKVNNVKNKISSIVCINNGKKVEIKGDIFISSMAIKDLIASMNDVPKNVHKIATNLPYRDFISLGLIVDKLKLKNETKYKTLNNIIPDCWIYIQSGDVKLGRVQIFNNWSPYLVKNIDKSVSLGLEYFCTKGDWLWNLDDDSFKKFAFEELCKIGLISPSTKIMDYHVERVEKAYPAYFDSYSEFDKIKNYLNKFSNLYCIGRNGQHRYNNMDHSMKCAMVCINSILNKKDDKSDIWNVNTEKEYYEEESK